jgi:hypothetical protein
MKACKHQVQYLQVGHVTAKPNLINDWGEDGNTYNITMHCKL